MLNLEPAVEPQLTRFCVLQPYRRATNENHDTAGARIVPLDMEMSFDFHICIQGRPRLKLTKKVG